MKKKYYGYVIEKSNIKNVVSSWPECQAKTKGANARYKSFSSEAEAWNWVNSGGIYEDKKAKINELKKQLKPGVYFDAGTGRGIGVEVRVTDILGNSLLHKVIPSHMINEFGNYLAKEGSTNNYGELIGLYLALDYSIKYDVLNIYGDSQLVINYWCCGFYNRDNLNEKTVNLIEKVSEKKKIFDSLGGTIEYVSGDINPADLGFHK